MKTTLVKLLLKLCGIGLDMFGVGQELRETVWKPVLQGKEFEIDLIVRRNS